MANPLYNPNASSVTNNGLLQIIKDIRDFQQTFKGNPQQEVQNMLNSGKITQAQFNSYAQTASEIMFLINR